MARRGAQDRAARAPGVVVSTSTSPFAFDILLEESRLTRDDNHIERRLSSLRGQYSDFDACRRLIESGRCIYSYLGGSFIQMPPKEPQG